MAREPRMADVEVRQYGASTGSRERPVDLEWPTGRPELLPFLPFVYVAWSDGVLNGEELRRIGERLRRHDGLDEGSRSLLLPWLDPDAPPGAASLEGLRTRIRAVRAGPAEATLLSLGLAMVRAESAEGFWSEPGATAALEELEAELGVVAREAVRDLVQPDEAPVEDLEQAPFAVLPLRDYLDQPHAGFRREVLTLLEAPLFRFRHDLSVGEHRARVMEALGVLAAKGWGGLAYPVESGGSGDPGRALALFETLAFGDHSALIKYGVQFGLFGGSIHQLGTARHHERYLGAVARLELPGCYAMTETGHGSNVRDIETVARYDHDTGTFVLHTPSERARKDWIGGAAASARLATVFAQLEVGEERHGVHAFLVPLRDEGGNPLPGIRLEDCGLKVGLNGVDNGKIAFDQVRVPRENLLDRFAAVDSEGLYTSPIVGQGKRFFTMLGTLVAGRISIAAASVSAAKTGLTIALRYGARRRQFGPAGGPEVPINHYLGHQRLLLPRLAQTYALHFAVRHLTDGYVESLAPDTPEEATRVIESGSAALKVLASEACVRTLQACREACGGQGYLAENRLGRLREDTDIFTTFEGANPVLLQLVAKALLSEYREAMGDVRLRDVVRLLAERAQTGLTQLNPVVTRRSDPEHLRSPEFHAAAFRYREARLLRSVARRLKAALDGGADTFEAMNLCQDHLMALGRAHGDRLCDEAFRMAVARAPQPGISETLRPLSILHALTRLEEGAAWFLETGYFEAPKVRAMRAVVNDLCRELSGSAVALVDAFGIPDAVLEAPAGLGGA